MRSLNGYRSDCMLTAFLARSIMPTTKIQTLTWQSPFFLSTATMMTLQAYVLSTAKAG